MTGNTVEEERLAYRKRYWDDCFGAYTKKHFTGSRKNALFEFFRALYFGEPFQFDEKLLTAEGRGHTNHNFCFLSLMYQSTQTPAVWQSFITDEAPKFGIDTFEKMVKEFDPLITNSYCDPMQWGWTGLEDYEFFRFWFGRAYEPASYTFMHEEVVFPFNSSILSSCLTAGMTSTLEGYCHHDCRFVYVYDYWKQVLFTLDPEIFYPESHICMPCFASVDDSQMRNLVEAKVWVATLLSAIHAEKELKKDFNRKKKAMCHDHLPYLPYGMESYTANAYWQLPNLVMLRQRLANDILIGEFPDSIVALNEWASHSDAEPRVLDGSTRQEYRYEHPGKSVKQGASKRHKEKKEEKKPDINKEIDELIISDELITRIRPQLEKYRAALRDCGVPIPRQPLTRAVAIKDLLKANRIKCVQVAMNDMEILSQHGSTLDYLRFLIPQHVMVLDIEPFDGCSVPEIKGYYRDLWQGLRTMTIHHKKIKSLKADLQELDDEEYNVSVSFSTEDKDYLFKYEIKDTYADPSVIDHIAEFHKASALPWNFLQDSLDDTVIIYYLPECAQELLPGSPDVIV